MSHPEYQDSDGEDRAVNIDDFRTLARARISSEVFDYIDCGACDGITVKGNRRALDEIRLVPFCLRDVHDLDLSVNLLQHSFNFPLGFSPTAFHRLVHEAGEISAAKAAKRLNIPMILSAMSSVSLEDVVEASGNQNLWFQTYIFKDRELTKTLLQRAQNSGYKSLIITIGCPVAGKRDTNIRNKFNLPKGILAANFKHNARVIHNNPIHSIDGAELDASLTWRDIEWLRCNTELPIILKGIMNPVDVKPALDLRISGLIISNHGGRQLDTEESTAHVLPEIAEAVSGRVPLLVDSGFRRGTDVLKAVALGADGVLLGRPILWALAVDGEKGVIDAIDLLVEELRIAMQLVGCCSINEIRMNSKTIIRR